MVEKCLESETKMPSYTLSTTNPHMGPFGIYNMNPAEKQEKEGEGGGDVLVFNLL